MNLLARRINIELSKLKKINQKAFMFIDEPGLQSFCSGISGYFDVAARRDMCAEIRTGIFLLELDLDILALDVYSNGEIFVAYASSIKQYLERGGMFAWGILPSNVEPFEKENLDSFENRLIEMRSSFR